MARKQASPTPEKVKTTIHFKTVWRGMLLATLASAAVVALLWGGIELERFLVRDPQFLLAMPHDDGEESPGMTISGLAHSSRANIVRIFERDYGRSLYLMPLRQRREELLRLPWVQDATITRVWPNRVQVRIVEREPIAFLQLPDEEALPFLDADGRILLQETKENLKLPVLTGVTRAHDIEARRARARKVARLMRDAGELGAKISEVDASDPDNLKVMQEAGGKAVTLILGDRSFKRRLEKFRMNGEELVRRDPDRTTFDLRVEGSIFARPTSADGVIAAVEQQQP